MCFRFLVLDFVDPKRIFIVLGNVFHRKIFKYCFPGTEAYESFA